MTGSPRPQNPRTLAALVASVVLAVATGFALTAVPASAGEPCSQSVIDDWFDDGTVDQSYPKHCYTEAINDLRRDAQTYSNAPDDIRAAMLAAFKHSGNGTPPGPPQSSGGGNEQSTSPST